jgi:hypothetical protein
VSKPVQSICFSDSPIHSAAEINKKYQQQNQKPKKSCDLTKRNNNKMTTVSDSTSNYTIFQEYSSQKMKPSC